MLDIRFPEDIAYGACGGPQYATNIASTVAGDEIRNIASQEPRIRYNVSHGIKNEKQFNELIAFFRIVQGRAKGFRFKDWLDYKSTSHIATGDNKQQAFQLIKEYSIGEMKVKRKIYKPRQSTLHIQLDKTKLAEGIDYECNYQNGLVFFTNPPPKGSLILAKFEFDIPARFDTDHLNASLDEHGISSWNDIAIVEIKP